MDATRPVPAVAGAGEALSTIGLFLNIFSIVAFTVCLATFGTGSATVGAVLAVIAVGAFLASLGCFVRGGQPSHEADGDGTG